MRRRASASAANAPDGTVGRNGLKGPTVPSGAFAALAEARLRKPTYADFISLREDVRTVAGWYRNRVARTLLVFMLTCFGTVAGEWIAIARIVGKLAT